MSSSEAAHETSARRIVTQVTSLDALVGAHPGALRAIFGAGKPTDATERGELGDAPRGSLLALEHGVDLFLVLRPVVRALAGGLLPWKGKTFDHGGNSGQNVIVGGKRVLRFRAEVAASRLDGKPALILRYDAPEHENPWPARLLRDELRTVGKGIAIGPVLAPVGGASVAVAWFGLEAR